MSRKGGIAGTPARNLAVQALSLAESVAVNTWLIGQHGHGYYPKKQRQSTENIDVGCTKNLMHHKKAFPSIEAAFDPAINVAYGAKYLAALHPETVLGLPLYITPHVPSSTSLIEGGSSGFGETSKPNTWNDAHRPTKEYELTARQSIGRDGLFGTAANDRKITSANRDTRRMNGHARRSV